MTNRNKVQLAIRRLQKTANEEQLNYLDSIIEYIDLLEESLEESESELERLKNRIEVE